MGGSGCRRVWREEWVWGGSMWDGVGLVVSVSGYGCYTIGVVGK